MNLLEALKDTINWRGLVDYYNACADPQNALTKDDRKYFQFSEVHVFFELLKRVNPTGTEEGIPQDSELSLELQTGLVETCRKSAFALSSFGGLLQTYLNQRREKEAKAPSNPLDLLSKKMSSSRAPKWLENIIILLAESAKPLGVRTLHFFLGAGRFLRQMDKQSAEYESLTKSLGAKASVLNQPKRIVGLLEELFKSEERTRNPRLQSKTLRSLGNYIQRKQKSSRVLIAVLEILLDLLSQNPKTKKNGLKVEKKKGGQMTYKKRRFFGEVIEELTNIVLKVPHSKWEAEALQLIYSDQSTRDTLAKSVQFMFKVSSRSSKKGSRLSASQFGPNGVSALLWKLEQLSLRLQDLSKDSATSKKPVKGSKKKSKTVSTKASKLEAQESARLFGYAKNLIEMLASSDDDEHLQNIKSKVRNLLLKTLSSKKGYLNFRAQTLIQTLETSLKEGDFTAFKLTTVEVNGVLTAMCDSANKTDFEKHFIGQVDRLIKIFGALPSKVRNFEELMSDMSARRIFKRLADFLFPRCKRLVLSFRSKAKGESNGDYVTQRSKTLRKLVKTLCNSVETSTGQTNEDEEQSEIENEDEMGLNRTQISMNVTAARKFTKLMEALEETEINDKSESLLSLLGVLSVRNLFLDDLVKEDLDSEQSQEIVEEEEDFEEQSEEEEIEELEDSQAKDQLSGTDQTDKKDSQSIEEESENPTPSKEDLDQVDNTQDALTSSIRDISKFVEEYLEKESVTTNDLQILLDACCVLLTLKDSRARSQILTLLKAFAGDFDEEVVDLVDQSLFEDINERLLQIEEGAGVRLEADHLDIGNDIMLDSMDEDGDEEQEQVQETATPVIEEEK